MRRCTFWCLLGAQLLVALSARVQEEAGQGVIDWVKSNGGQIVFKVGKACPSCPRGAIAAQDYEPKAVIARVPFNLSLSFKNENPESGTSVAVIELILRMHKDPAFNATYKAWWDSQPAPEDILCLELLTPGQLAMLQSEWLESYAHQVRTNTEEWYTGKRRTCWPFPLLAPANMTLDIFNYMTCLVVTRAFGIERNVDGEVKERTFLFPAVDMLNHAEPAAANADYEEAIAADGAQEELVFTATKPIKEGEEITFSYGHFMHRPDFTFALHGFVLKRDPPLLFAQDLPGFDFETDAFGETHPADEAYDPKGRDAIHEEVQRLQRILEGLPTTLEQDQEELARLAQAEGDWRTRTILDLRIARKRALRHRISHLQKLLEEL